MAVVAYLQQHHRRQVCARGLAADQQDVGAELIAGTVHQPPSNSNTVVDRRRVRVLRCEPIVDRDDGEAEAVQEFVLVVVEFGACQAHAASVYVEIHRCWAARSLDNSARHPSDRTIHGPARSVSEERAGAGASPLEVFEWVTRRVCWIAGSHGQRRVCRVGRSESLRPERVERFRPQLHQPFCTRTVGYASVGPSICSPGYHRRSSEQLFLSRDPLVVATKYSVHQLVLPSHNDEQHTVSRDAAHLLLGVPGCHRTAGVERGARRNNHDRGDHAPFR